MIREVIRWGLYIPSPNTNVSDGEVRPEVNDSTKWHIRRNNPTTTPTMPLESWELLWGYLRDGKLPLQVIILVCRRMLGEWLTSPSDMFTGPRIFELIEMKSRMRGPILEWGLATDNRGPCRLNSCKLPLPLAAGIIKCHKLRLDGQDASRTPLMILLYPRRGNHNCIAYQIKTQTLQRYKLHNISFNTAVPYRANCRFN